MDYLELVIAELWPEAEGERIRRYYGIACE